jgi:transcriptional regulator NrdR family protein
MACPYCGSEASAVIDSRPARAWIRRRRKCLRCSGRYTTYELLVSDPSSFGKSGKLLVQLPVRKLTSLLTLLRVTAAELNKALVEERVIGGSDDA